MAATKRRQRKLVEIVMKKNSFIPGIKDGRGETVHYKVDELAKRKCTVEINRDDRTVTFHVAGSGKFHEFPFESVARMVYEGAETTSYPVEGSATA